jgi:excisionase family DNA binding protein
MDSMNSSRPGPNLAALLGVREVAALLGCSARHVYRMADAGRMPRPLKLGQLVRWRRGELLAWIDDGCPAVRTNRRAAQ